MATKVVMPKLSDTMEEGILLKWLKKEGDYVESGDSLAEVETDKAVLELEAYGTGVLRKILVNEDEIIPVGELIAIIAREDEDLSSILEERHEKVEAVREGIKVVREEGEGKTKEVSKEVVSQPIKASPLAKRLARENGIDLQRVKGTGPGGKIVKKDIEAFGRETKDVEPVGEGAYEDRPLSLMRKTIASRMTQSKTTIPHYYVTVDVDMEKTLELKDALTVRYEGVKVSITHLIIGASALAIIDFPQVNASFLGDKIRYFKDIHIGFAVGLEDGLISPVIRNCHKKDLKRIIGEINELIERAKDKRLKQDEYTGATFTISNLGMLPVDEFAAVIDPPQSTILAVGGTREVPVVKKGIITAGKKMKLTLSCDHRVVDGLQAARFLERLKTILENPVRLLVE
jgi:pyruvate dehydrogenase E2 component (dihydrolipoamide acetyltransferase)